MKKIFKLLTLIGISSLFVAYGTITGGVMKTTQLNSFVHSDSVLYILGIGLLYKAIFKFKESNKSKDQVQNSNFIAIFLFIFAVLCLSVPILFGVTAN